jgi:hypothetical protein
MSFKAKNSMTAIEAFRNRTFYNSFAFSESGEINILPESTKNYWFVENLFYGRIRELSGEVSIIVPNSNYLLGCRGTLSLAPARALDFVVDAFENMRFEYEKARIQSNRISDDSVNLSKINAHAGFSDNFKNHESVQREVNRRFVLYAEEYKLESDKIFSFDDFVPFFMQFLLRFLEISPVTSSSYLLSKRSTPMTSGLCLEIANLDHSKDEDKSRYFLDDPNFQIYKILAANSGFAIDKNAPWRLVADIASKQMLDFASKRVPGLNSAEDVLDYYFNDVRDVVDEIEQTKTLFIRAYNTFATASPVVLRASSELGQNFTSEIKRRTRESFDSVNSRIETGFWYDKFVKIKNVELGLGYDDMELKNLSRNASNLESSFDRYKAFGYIKKRMTPVIASEGSLEHENFKLNGKTADDSAVKNAKNLTRGLNKLVY